MLTQKMYKTSQNNRPNERRTAYDIARVKKYFVCLCVGKLQLSVWISSHFTVSKEEVFFQRHEIFEIS